MGEQDQATTMAIVDRLGRLEGLLVGLQNSITQSQSQWAGSQARVERLEQRLVELESRQVTRDDLRELASKVDELVASDARQSGGVGLVRWSVNSLAPWLAVVVALAALFGVGMNREAIQNQRQHTEAQP